VSCHLPSRPPAPERPPTPPSQAVAIYHDDRVSSHALSVARPPRPSPSTAMPEWCATRFPAEEPTTEAAAARQGDGLRATRSLAEGCPPTSTTMAERRATLPSQRDGRRRPPRYPQGTRTAPSVPTPRDDRGRRHQPGWSGDAPGAPMLRAGQGRHRLQRWLSGVPHAPPQAGGRLRPPSSARRARRRATRCPVEGRPRPQPPARMARQSATCSPTKR
jgi:hypothetical protein